MKTVERHGNFNVAIWLGIFEGKSNIQHGTSLFKPRVNDQGTALEILESLLRYYVQRTPTRSKRISTNLASRDDSLNVI